MPVIRAMHTKNWDEILLQVKPEAKWFCEQCQRPCRQPSEPLAVFLERVKVWRTLRKPLPPDFAEAFRRNLLIRFQF